MHTPGIEPESTDWKSVILTIILHVPIYLYVDF